MIFFFFLCLVLSRNLIRFTDIYITFLLAETVRDVIIKIVLFQDT